MALIADNIQLLGLELWLQCQSNNRKSHNWKYLTVVIFKINIFVLKAGANPGFKDKAGRHSLHWAAHHGHVKCLKSLLNSKSVPTNTAAEHHGNLTLMAERDNVIIRSTMLKNLTIFHSSHARFEFFLGLDFHEAHLHLK